MRTICFVNCVILGMPLLAHSQEKVPKTTLLHFSNPALYFEYAPGIVNVNDLRAGMIGKMPSDCTYRFAGVDRQRYVRVDAKCPGVFERRFYFESADAMKRFAKCHIDDELVFQGRFRVVEDKNIDTFGVRVFILQGLDNNSSATPTVALDAGGRNGQEVRGEPENLLDEFRRRQKRHELYVTGRVLLVVGQAAVVHRFAPDKARELLLDERRKVGDDPELSALPREALRMVLLDAPDLDALWAELEARLGRP